MRSPGRSSVCDCAPSPINSGRVEIVTPDCRTNYPCRSSVASDRLSGAALVSQRRSTTGRPTTRAPRTAVRCGAPLCRCCSRAGPGRVDPSRFGHSPSTPAATASVAWTSATWTCQSRSAPPLDERQGDHDPLGVGEGLARGGAGWLGIHGPDLHAGQGPGLVLSTPTGAALLVTSTQRLPEAKTIKNRVHLDPTTGADDRAGEIERLLQLGARRRPLFPPHGGACFRAHRTGSRPRPEHRPMNQRSPTHTSQHC